MLEACWQSHAGAAEEGEQGEGGALRQVCIGAEGGERGGVCVCCGKCVFGWGKGSEEGGVCAVASTYLGWGRGARRRGHTAMKIDRGKPFGDEPRGGSCSVWGLVIAE